MTTSGLFCVRGLLSVAVVLSLAARVSAQDSAASTRFIERRLPVPDSGEVVFRCATFSPDGKTLAVGTDNAVKLFDVATRRVRASVQTNHIVRSLAYSPDGQTLAAGFGKQAKLWDAATGRERRPLSIPEGMRAIAFSPDGQRVLVGQFNGDVSVWNPADGRRLATVKGHVKLIFQVAFAPDGKTVATASADETIKLWELPATMR